MQFQSIQSREWNIFSPSLNTEGLEEKLFINLLCLWLLLHNLDTGKGRLFYSRQPSGTGCWRNSGRCVVLCSGATHGSSTERWFCQSPPSCKPDNKTGSPHLYWPTAFQPEKTKYTIDISTIYVAGHHKTSAKLHPLTWSYKWQEMDKLIKFTSHHLDYWEIWRPSALWSLNAPYWVVPWYQV